MRGPLRNLWMSVAVILAVTTLLTPTNAYTQIPANDKILPPQLETISRVLDQLRHELFVIESVGLCPHKFEFRTQRIRREIRRLADELTQLSGVFDRHAAGISPSHAVGAEIENGVKRLAKEIASLHTVTDQLGLDCSPQLNASDDPTALTSDGAISGTVTDSATSLPIEGERVRIYDDSGYSLGYDFTDANGEYAITMGLPAGTYFARVASYSGYLGELYNDIACIGGWCDVTTGTPIVVGAGEDVTGIDFALDKGGSVSGIVTDAATAAAIALGYVWIYDESGYRVADGITDSNGNYTTQSALTEGTYFAVTDSFAGGYLNELYNDIPCASGCDVTTGTPIAVSAGEDVTGIDFALDRVSSISGVVTDASSGEGIADVYVEFVNEDGTAAVTSGTTNSEGRYTSRDPLTAGTYFARTYNSLGYLDEIFDNIPCPNGCDASTGTPIVLVVGENLTGVDFSLEMGSSIAGTITDAASGVALPSIWVRPSPTGTNARSDADGNYVITGLAQGTYSLETFNQTGYLDELYDDIPCPFGCDELPGTPIAVGSGEQVTGVDFALNKGARIYGRIIDSATGSGINGINAGQVYVYDSNGSEVAHGYPDSNGDYYGLRALPPGTYFVRTAIFSFLGYLNELYDDIPCAAGCDVTSGTPIVIASSDDVTGIDFVLDQAGSISGSVTGVDGGQVRIYNEDGELVTSAGFAFGSSYTAGGLVPGTYFARTSNSEGALDELYDDILCVPDCDVTTGTPITVGSGESVTGIDFDLVYGGSISGVVTDAVTDVGIGGVTVDIFDSGGSFATAAVTAADGTFSTPSNLAADTYYAHTELYSEYLNELYDDIPCTLPCDPTTGTPIIVGLGAQVTGIDFALDREVPPSAMISGTLTNAFFAAAIAGSDVRLHDQEGSILSTAITDSEGAYLFSSLAPGTYFVSTSAMPAYLDEIFDDVPCTGSCDPTSGTSITIGAGEERTGVDFELLPSSVFSDGFESGGISLWSATAGGL